MAYAMNGRFTSYSQALRDKDALADTIARNVYRGSKETGEPCVQSLVSYMQNASNMPIQKPSEMLDWPAV